MRRWIETGFAVSIALGLTLLAHAAFALGAVGVLTRGALLGLIVLVHLLGIPVWREMRLGGWRIGLGLILALAPMFLLALYPPTAFDETLYHLPIARAFARTGSLPFLPELRVPVFPPLNELLFAGLLLLADDVSIHLVQLLATTVTAALLIAWGRRSFSPAAGWLAAAAFLGNPIVVHLAGTGYVEPLLTLFITAAVFSLERWRESRKTAWLVLAAVFAGSAAGVKYLGLFFVAAVLFVVLRERRARDLVIACAVILAVLVPTYGRIVYHTGNPLFPFYPEIFGSSLWDPEPLAPRTLRERVTGYLSLPWDVVFEREDVGRQPPYSPFYLLGLPLLVLGFVREPRVRSLLGLVLAYSLLFPILPPDARYLAVVLPLLSLALGASAARWSLRPWFATALALLLFLPGWLYGLYRIEREGPLPATAGERELYLTRELPAYAALQHLDRLRGRDYTVYGIFTENMAYHSEGTLLGDWSGLARYTRMHAVLNDPELFHRRLRELGVEYLLNVREHGVRLPDGPDWHRLFRRIYSDGRAEIYELSPFRGRPGT